MSLIPRVKCSRCEQSYSGLKYKCPFCGAGRGRSGKRASDTADAAARRMITLILLAALVITLISVIAIPDLSDDPTPGTSTTPNDPGTEEVQGLPGEIGDGDGEDGGDPAMPQTPIPPPVPTPEPVVVTSLDINWQFRVGNTLDVSIAIGDTLDIWSEVFPRDAEVEVRWNSSDNTIVLIHVDADSAGFRDARIEGRSVGHATVTATAEGHSVDLIVRVRAR